MTRITVDPITRIEGHLRIDVEVDRGKVQNSWSSGQMWRGIEIILQDRDPRDAWLFTQRICGVCTTVHSMASIRAVEDALNIQIPDNARLIRNLIMGIQNVQDHVIHFYHLHALDWVDIVSALSADPAATAKLAQSVSNWPKSSATYFKGVQDKVAAFAGTGRLGPFQNAYWGHSAYKLPPEANLMAVAHYLEALEWQRDVAKLHAVFGGKNPHPMFLVGGTPNPIDLESDSAVNAKKLALVQSIIDRMRMFVDQVYVPDTLAIAGFYKDWFARGEGLCNAGDGFAFTCTNGGPARAGQVFTYTPSPAEGTGDEVDRPGNRIAVFGRSQRRAHLSIGVVISNRLIGQAEMVRGGLGRHHDAACFGRPDRRHSLPGADMGEVQPPSRKRGQFDVTLHHHDLRGVGYTRQSQPR